LLEARVLALALGPDAIEILVDRADARRRRLRGQEA
jgi:hypothetical protein